MSAQPPGTGALFIAVSFGLYLFLFLLPGFSLAANIAARQALTEVQAIICIVVTGGALGYVSFWCFFANKLLGKSFTLLAYAVAVSFLTKAVYRQRTSTIRLARQAAVPVLLVLISGICYLSCFYLFLDAQDPGVSFADVRFFETVRPGDNLIPEIFADKVYGHEPLHPFCCGDWLSSDRPPLQSGIFLLLRPLRVAGSAGLQYQLLSAALQCLWMVGVWCVLAVLNTPRRRLIQVIVLLAFSGFLLYNSVYVWPKLLAATYMLFAITCLLNVIRSGRSTHIDMILGGISLALAMLAHPGSVFSLFAFALLSLARWRVFRIRHIGLAVMLIAVLLLPWGVYQRFVDPPGNRLLKMHLAGVFGIDQRSFSKALLDSYRQHPISDIVEFKAKNFLTLFGSEPFDGLGLSAVRASQGLNLDRSVVEQSRFVQREYIWNAVGWLNLGWIALIMFAMSRKGLFHPVIPYSGLLLVIAVVNFLFWCLIDFGPGGTLTTHSSYTDILLLEVGLAGWVLGLPTLVLFIVLGLQLFNFIVVWVCYPPLNFFSIDSTWRGSFSAFAVLCAACLLGVFVWSTLKHAQESVTSVHDLS